MKSHLVKPFAIQHLTTVLFAGLVGVMSLPTVWGADVTTDAGQVKRQALAMPALRQSMASAGGYETKTIELQHTAHLLTATVVNSKQNDAVPVDREHEATALAAAAEAAMKDKSEFEAVGSIHINYISRVGKDVKSVQNFDFFRSPANVFVLHKS